MYIGGGARRAFSLLKEAQTVMVYDPKQDLYDTLPPYTCTYFSMAVVNSQLVLVGGRDVQNFCKVTNMLGVWNEPSKTWIHPLPPMTIACNWPSVATHSRWLVVIGGSNDAKFLSRVEILDTTEPNQWYHAASLPRSCSRIIPAVIGNVLSLGWLH